MPLPSINQEYIDASHNYERAHMDGLNATTNWIMAYLLD